MKAGTWAIGCMAAAGAGIFVFWKATTVNPKGDFSRQPYGSPTTLTVSRTNLRPDSEKSPSATPTLAEYKNTFAQSHNYWKFAHDALPAAKAGNADAQFYLSKALEYCTEHNSLYFQRHGRPLELDEGLQYAVQRHLPIDIAQEVYDRCHEFVEHNASALGSAAEWLVLATASGQPLAQATTATELLMQKSQHDFARASGSPEPTNNETISNDSDARELLRAAVQSKDPEVLFSIGDALTLLDPSNADKNMSRLAWWLVACQRGLDCSANAEWVRNSCAGATQCASADSPSDLVEILAGEKWPEVQQRAQKINASLDNAQWGELGLGS